MSIAIEQLKATGGQTDDVVHMFQAMRDQLYAPIETPGIPSLKRYRDYLLHGGIEPEDDGLAEALSAAVDANSYRLTSYTAARGGLHIDGSGYLAFPDGPVLYPLFIIVDGYPAVLESVTNARATFHTANRTQPVVAYDSSHQGLLRDLMRWVVHPASDTQSSAAQLYQDDIKRDLPGFCEPGEPVGIDGPHSPFSVPWVRRISPGPQRRTDRFRVGPDGTRQWDDGGAWRTYSDFLKTMSNWPT